MYENPVLFPQISNRESWIETIQIVDADTGDLIALTDGNGNPLYAVTLELQAADPRGHDCGGYGTPSSFYDFSGAPAISASLADYISIPDTGTIAWTIPKSKMATLAARTYDVYLTIDPNGEDDGRQLLIGRLPVLYGGRNT